VPIPPAPPWPPLLVAPSSEPQPAAPSAAQALRTQGKSHFDF
jgi:hypothetical protein